VLDFVLIFMNSFCQEVLQKSSSLLLILGFD